MTKPDPFTGFRGSPEIIRLAVMLSAIYTLSLRNVQDLPNDFERGCFESGDGPKLFEFEGVRCSIVIC